MHPDMFGYPVEVSRHEEGILPFRKDFNSSEILQCLNAFFGLPTMHENPFQFYKVNRPGFGIDRAITVLSNPRNEYYAIRVFIKPDTEVSNEVFNPAVYRRGRIQQLYSALRDHYPATYFLNTQNLLIILQEFFFFPVCQFKKRNEIRGLLEIIWFASKAQILLDFNQNHWLVSDEGHVFYVDTDFMGQQLPDRQKALSENLNQSMIFITPSNCDLIKKVIPEFATRGFDYPQFVDEFLVTLKKYLDCWDTTEEISAILQQKLDCLKRIISAFLTN
ncbi:MAG: hypothetical protein JSV04_05025 [Candidatus Heimdallarchaeota archaeon]|nr:MAG: hypothetical protein JSV04_05025 [Candidatus Heimdallarchaeota archaeon]